MQPWELWLLTSDESCSAVGTHRSGVCSRRNATEGMEKTPETHCKPTTGMRGMYVLTHAAVGAAVQQPRLPLARPWGSQSLGLEGDHVGRGHCQQGSGSSGQFAVWKEKPSEKDAAGVADVGCLAQAAAFEDGEGSTGPRGVPTARALPPPPQRGELPLSFAAKPSPKPGPNRRQQHIIPLPMQVKCLCKNRGSFFSEPQCFNTSILSSHPWFIFHCYPLKVVFF